MKKKNFIWTIAFINLYLFGYSQDGKESIIYTTDSVKLINKTCIYPNGQEGLMKDISENFIIPKQARKDNLMGKIYLQITVDTGGYATGKIIKGLRPDVDSAAIEMTRKLKRFVPAKMGNRVVPTTLNVPLKF